jgi:TorA maturation chaperone TorD
MENDRKNLLKGYNMLLYFAGSMIMYEPTEECVIDFWTNGALQGLPVSSTNPRFIKAASLLRDSCKDKTMCRKTLQDDYLRLFADSGISLTPAHASRYLCKGDHHDSTYNEVSEFYKSYGWNSRSRIKRADDHLGIELLFLTSLVDRYLLLDDDPSCREMKNEIHRFIDEHMLSWIPKWNEQIQEHAHTPGYRGIGILILACIEDLYGIFS